MQIFTILCQQTLTVVISYCFAISVKDKPATNGATWHLPTQNFQKPTQLLGTTATYNHFTPLPKISAGCGPGHRFLVWKNRMVSPQSQHSSESDVACGRITTKSHKIHFFNTPLFEQLACSCQVEYIVWMSQVIWENKKYGRKWKMVIL